MTTILLLIPLLPALGALVNGTRAFAKPLQPKNRTITNLFALARGLHERHVSGALADDD